MSANWSAETDSLRSLRAGLGVSWSGSRLDERDVQGVVEVGHGVHGEERLVGLGQEVRRRRPEERGEDGARVEGGRAARRCALVRVREDEVVGEAGRKGVRRWNRASEPSARGRGRGRGADTSEKRRTWQSLDTLALLLDILDRLDPLAARPLKLVDLRARHLPQLVPPALVLPLLDAAGVPEVDVALVVVDEDGREWSRGRGAQEGREGGEDGGGGRDEVDGEGARVGADGVLLGGVHGASSAGGAETERGERRGEWREGERAARSRRSGRDVPLSGLRARQLHCNVP